MEYLLETNKGGSVAGKLEIVKTSLEKARRYAEKRMDSYKRDLDEQIPNFDDNYKLAQAKASEGHTKRKDMPVILPKDIEDIRNRLRNGYLDISYPYSPTTSDKDPFPQNLKGKEAEQFLQAGKEKFDGDKDDDKIKVLSERAMVSTLTPIQEQIYFDKSIEAMAKGGVEASKKWLTDKNQSIIVSLDGYVIDGHHRYLSAMLEDPSMKVHTLVIDLPIATLLPLMTAYGDARGNKRNA